MAYHFRNLLGTRFTNADGTDTVSYEDFERTLLLAYQKSADENMAVYICRGSGDDQPVYTEVCCVRACK